MAGNTGLVARMEKRGRERLGERVPGDSAHRELVEDIPLEFPGEKHVAIPDEACSLQ